MRNSMDRSERGCMLGVFVVAVLVFGIQAGQKIAVGQMPSLTEILLVLGSLVGIVAMLLRKG